MGDAKRQAALSLLSGAYWQTGRRKQFLQGGAQGKQPVGVWIREMDEERQHCLIT